MHIYTNTYVITTMYIINRDLSTKGEYRRGLSTRIGRPSIGRFTRARYVIYIYIYIYLYVVYM
jgi:hypothetical protein